MQGMPFTNVQNDIIDCLLFVLISLKSIPNTSTHQPDWSFLNAGKFPYSFAQGSLLYLHLFQIHNLNLNRLGSLTWCFSSLCLSLYFRQCYHRYYCFIKADMILSQRLYTCCSLFLSDLSFLWIFYPSMVPWHLSSISSVLFKS